MAVATRTLWPVAAEGTSRILEIGEEAKVPQAHAFPVLAQMVNGHPFRDLAMPVDPGSPVSGGHEAHPIFLPPDLRVTVAGDRVSADQASIVPGDHCLSRPSGNSCRNVH
jgi:hypothetical protein